MIPDLTTLGKIVRRLPAAAKRAARADAAAGAGRPVSVRGRSGNPLAMAAGPRRCIAPREPRSSSRPTGWPRAARAGRGGRGRVHQPRHRRPLRLLFHGRLSFADASRADASAPGLRRLLEEGITSFECGFVSLAHAVATSKRRSRRPGRPTRRLAHIEGRRGLARCRVSAGPPDGRARPERRTARQGAAYQGARGFFAILIAGESDTGQPLGRPRGLLVGFGWSAPFVVSLIRMGRQQQGEPPAGGPPAMRRFRHEDRSDRAHQPGAPRGRGCRLLV